MTDLVEGMIRALEQKAEFKPINLRNPEEVVNIK